MHQRSVHGECAQQVGWALFTGSLCTGTVHSRLGGLSVPWVVSTSRQETPRTLRVT